jgi:glutathione synthase/RimK-type ligase-like ATP-grasp enzyme
MSFRDYGLARSKWRQSIAFSNDPIIVKKTPKTSLYNKNNIKNYIEKYKTVYLKPDEGGKGKGVIKLSRVGKNFIIQKGTKRHVMSKPSDAYDTLQKFTKGRAYIIQQGISLIQVNQRPIDFRILLLKPRGRWIAMGVMGKWAAKNKFVTNYSSGGKAITLQKALRHKWAIGQKESAHLEAKLKSLGLHMARTHFNYAKELGLDIGIDQNKNIWIIEGNTRPGIKLFKSHEDHQLYSKIRNIRKQIRIKG